MSPRIEFISSEIKQVLVWQPGFTPEEPAFIFNYDIKCRLSHDTEEE